MANAPVEAIRQSSRYELNLYRKKLKDLETDSRRCMAQMQLEDVDVALLANKLKNKSAVTETDLNKLKNMLIEDAEGISVVLNTEGALRGLVRELTCTDVKRQVEAAGCLCNMALGDSRACTAITRAAAAYLVAELTSLTVSLASVCAWTLGNLCGSGAAVSALVCAAGGVGALCAAAAEGASGKEGGDRADAAAAALTLLAHACGDLLSKEHLDLIIKSTARSALRTNIRLLYILTCHKDFSDPEQKVQRMVIVRFNPLMEHHVRYCAGAGCCDLVYLVRILANMVGGNIHVNFLRYMSKKDGRITRFRSLVKDPYLKTSMLWLLGNMMSVRRDLRTFIVDFNQRKRVAAPTAPTANPAPPPPAPPPAVDDEEEEDVPEVIELNRMEEDDAADENMAEAAPEKLADNGASAIEEQNER